MSENLQQTGFRDSRYERPSQKWVCGWTAAGNPCPLGPTRQGGCNSGAQSECKPHKESGRWHCTRLQIFGGPCPDGPKPDGECCHPPPTHPVCQPRRSLRAKRTYFTIAVLAFAIGALLVMLTGPSQLSFVSPGPLTQAHQAVAASVAPASDCSACHQALSDDPSLLSAIFAQRRPFDDSHNCMTCHFAGQPKALLVHSADASWLQEKTAQIRRDAGQSNPTLASSLASFGGTPADAHNGQIACSTCHHEHHGADHNLKTMSNTACQICHTRQFDGFAKGHPEFSAIDRRGVIGPGGGGGGGRGRSIQFNHANHRDVHIGAEKFDCRRCHDADLTGRFMRVKPFESSCAGCHAGGKTDHHGEAIKKINTSFYQYDREGVMPPLTVLLISGTTDAKQAAAVKRFAEEFKADNFEWEDNADVTDEEKAALTVGLKQLRQDLTSSNAIARQKRLATAFGVKEDDPKVMALADAMSPALFAILAVKEDAPVNYSATGHGDPLIVTLLDALAANANGDPKAEKSADVEDFRGNLRTRVFDAFRKTDSCIRCHAVTQPQPPDTSMSIRWKAPTAGGRDSSANGYRVFNHSPHLPAIHQKDACVKCHQLAEKLEPAENLITGGWRSHSRSQCATCHKPSGASDSCLTCHQYHHLRP